MRPRSRVRLRRGLLWLWPVLALGLRLLVATWRLRLVGAVDWLASDVAGEPRIYAFWHADLIPCGVALRRKLVTRGHRVYALVSRSGDGQLLARASSSFGFGAVRGSSSSGALAGLRGLYEVLMDRRESVAITPDGPRGPALEAKPGVAQLARLADVQIVPMAAAVSRSWRVRSWDRTVIPKPFARLVVVCGEPFRVATDEGHEEASARFGAVLDRLQDAAGLEAQAGRSAARASGSPK